MTTAIPYPQIGLVRPRAASSRRAGILEKLLLCYIALLPYQFEIGSKMNLAPSDLFLILVLPLAAGQLKYRKPVWGIWHFAIPLVFAAGALTTSLRIGGLDRYELINKYAGLLLPFLSYAAITTVATEWGSLRRMLRVFVLGVVFENTFAVGAFWASYFFGMTNPFVRYDGLRLSGMLLDPNAYGGLLVAAFVAAEGASCGSKPLLRGAVLWFTRVNLMLGILFTFSRSAWLGFVLAFLVLCVLRTAKALRLILACMIGAPCLLLLMGKHFLPVFERMASRPQQVQDRFDLIHIGVGMFSKYPFLGGGLGSFRRSAGEIAHNTAIWFLADFGLPGLIVLLGFLAWFFRKAWMAYRRAPATERPLVLGFLLAHTSMLGLAMGIEAFYQRHWWLIFALIAASYSITIRRPLAAVPRMERSVTHADQ